MPNKSRRVGEGSALDLLRGGKTLPKGLLEHRIADVERKTQARSRHRNGIDREMAKHWSQIQDGSKPDIHDSQTTEALDGLLGLHKKLGSRKLAGPRVPDEIGGLLPGSISARVTPPFDYAITIPTVINGNPVVTASSNKNGQVNCSSVTVSHGRNMGSAYAEVGIFFHPMTSGTLRLSASPAFSFQWWTNSLSSGAPVRSEAEGQLTIYGVDRNFIISGGGAATFKSWDECSAQQVRFDLGSISQSPVSVQADVNNTLIYLLFVSVFAHVEGVGWPGSLAGAMMSVTVPSLTWQLDMSPPVAT